MSVLVVGGGSRSALAIVQSLGEKEIAIDVVDWNHKALAFASRFVRHQYPCRSPYDSKKGFVEDILSIIRAASYELVIPTVDETFLPLSDEREAFESSMPLPPETSVEIAFDKIKTATLAREEGISIPKTWELDNVLDADAVISQVGFPVVVKSRQSVLWDEDRGVRYSTGYAFSKEELESILRDRAPIGDKYLISEYIDGVTVGFGALSRSGKTLLKFQYERVRDSNPTGSGSSLRKSVPIDPLLASAIERMIRRLIWSGLIMFEFRRTQEGEYFLIEINGRPWGAMQLAISSGVDFPYWLYRSMQGEINPPQNYTAPLLCRWLVGDLWHLYFVMSGPPVGWKLPYPSRIKTIMTLLRPAREPICYDHIRMDDLRPFLRELSGWMLTMKARVCSRLIV